MDRFDCQFLMATFVNAYIHSFIRSASPTGNYYKLTLLYSRHSLRGGSPIVCIAYLNILYYYSLVPDLLQKTLALKPEDQLAMYYALQDSLKQRGILM